MAGKREKAEDIVLKLRQVEVLQGASPSKNRIHGVGRGDQTISRGRYPGVEHSRWVCRPCRGGIRGSRIHGRSISSFRARIHSKDKITLTYCFKESFLYRFNALFEESLSWTLRCFLEGLSGIEVQFSFNLLFSYYSDDIGYSSQGEVGCGPWGPPPPYYMES